MSAKKKKVRGLTAFTESGGVSGLILVARVIMIIAFALTAPVVLGVTEGRRFFWAAAIAILPVFWVVGGYHLWRQLCPLAIFSQLPRYLGIPGKRRFGPWMSSNYMLIQLALMLVALALRLTMTNGTPWALAAFLGAATGLAVLVGFVYTGKTWCNFICPVGMVEKFYTEPSRLLNGKNSQCAPCTACKKNCPDIDLEQGYWKESSSTARRIAYYSWPGIVVGFYSYFYLVAGNWDYYFSGAWTLEHTQMESCFTSPGFFFLPQIPIVAAAPLTLIASAIVSYAFFAVVESIARKASGDQDEHSVRHRVLAVAGLVAFVTFYFFGGQPTIRQAPGWVVTLFGTLVVIAGSAIFFRRWVRREQDFVQEKFAQKILKKWKWGDAPPADRLQDVVVMHSERAKEQEARMGVYKETIREMLADGVVTAGELAILDSLRAQLGVSDKDHQRVIDELTTEQRQLFGPEYRGSVELALQRKQYRRDIENAVLAATSAGVAPDAATLNKIRATHQVTEDEHQIVLKELMNPEGTVATAFRKEVADVARLAEVRAAALAAPDASSTSLGMLRHICQWRGLRHVSRAIRLLTPVSDAAVLDKVRLRLGSRNPAERADAAALFQEAVGTELATPLVESVARLLGDGARSDASLYDELAFLVDDSSPYVRAIVAHVLSRADDKSSLRLAQNAIEDEAALVRESAYYALGVRKQLPMELMARGMKDPVATVRKVAERAFGSAGSALATLATKGEEHIDTLTTLQRMMFLRQVALFAEMDPDDLEQVSSIAQEQNFGPQVTLCREGDPGDSVFLVVGGCVQVWTEHGGTKRVLDELKAGNCIGEMAVFDQAPRSANVTTTIPTRCLLVPADDFRALMHSRPAIMQRVVEVLVGRLRKMNLGERQGARP